MIISSDPFSFFGTGGVTKIGPDLEGNPFLENAANVPAEPGYFDLAGHSYNAGTQLLGGVEGNAGYSLSLEEIRMHLVSNGWEGEPIRLLSCSAGDPALGANSIGAKLSEYLEVPVKASASDITIFGNGSIVIRPGEVDSPLVPSITNPWTYYGH